MHSIVLSDIFLTHIGVVVSFSFLGGIEMMNPAGIEMIGWASSVILVLTIGKQIHKQWQEESSEGVSKWLFIGQVAASVGFTVYSWLVGNWVFVITNSLMLLSAIVGLGIVLRHRRRSSNKSAGQAELPKATGDV